MVTNVFSTVLSGEKTLPVKKRDFRAVSNFSMASPQRGYVLTGPTGSGKSTYALLPILRRCQRLLLIEPTDANVGNIIHEFCTLMPSVVAESYPAYKDFTRPVAFNGKNRLEKFVVMCVGDFSSMMANPSAVKAYDVVVLDEYHLVLQHMYDALAFVRTGVSFVNKYVLVSATPGRVEERPSFGRDVLMAPANFPLAILESDKNTLGRSCYNAQLFTSRGNGCVTMILPNRVCIDRIREYLLGLGVRVFVIDAATTQRRYREIQRCVGAGPMVILLDPSVEAGITIKMSVLINPGYTYMIEYDGSVVYTSYRPLTPAESIQRAGRAGRGIMTQYVYNTHLENLRYSNPGEYLMANTAVKMRAFGLDTEWLPQEVEDRFSRLAKINQEVAKMSLADNTLDPVVASYKYSESGSLYMECGGDAPGFFEDCGNSLRVYFFRGGYYILPVFSFVNPSFDPSELISESFQPAILNKMVDSNKEALGEMTLGRRIEILAENMDVYYNDFVSALDRVLDTGRQVYYHKQTKPSTLQDLFNDVDLDVASLFEALGRVDGYVLGTDEQNSATRTSRAFWIQAQDRKLYLTAREEFVRNGFVQKSPFVRAVMDELKDEINVAALSTLDGRSVNLEKYKRYATSDHTWYNMAVVKRAPEILNKRKEALELVRHARQPSSARSPERGDQPTNKSSSRSASQQRQ